MKSAFALLSAGTVSSHQLFDTSFDHHLIQLDVSDQGFLDYIVDFKKKYTTMDEYKLRAETFKKNVHFMNHHNADPMNQYKLHINKFTD